MDRIRLEPFRIVGATTPFHRMRLVATLLLVAMAVAWAALIALRPHYPAAAVQFGYARAFFEAAMVGGLADWFAVTALFRRPLGLPIPHTAIIPSNKDRIGDSLALFLKDNFLTPSVVARRLEAFDLAGALGRWLAAPPAAGDKAGRLRKALSQLLLQFADALDGATMAQLIAVTVTDRLRDRPVAPLLARFLRPLVDAGRHEALVEAVLAAAMNTVDARQEDIHAAVAARAPKYMPRFVDRGYAKAFIEGIQDHLFAMTEEAAELQRRDKTQIVHAFRERKAALEGTTAALPEPPPPPLALGREHPDRVAITAWLHRLADDLEDPHSTAATEVEAAKRELLASPATAAMFESVWTTLKAMLAEMVAAPPGQGRGGIALAAGEVIAGNAALADAINTLARRTAVSVVGSYGDAIVRLVSDTVRSWDASTVTDKLETAVGRDLQYIRINGTVIGGLVGLAIHAIGAAV